MTILPAVLDVPKAIAETIAIVGENVTHRDMSYAFAAAWIASRSDPVEEGHWRIPDNRLRGALGRTSRDDMATEEARFARLRDAVIRIDGVDHPAPTVLFRGGMPVRANLDDEMTWTIDPALVRAFGRSPDAVHVPRSLLANARGMTTLVLGLRLITRAGDRRSIRFHATVDELREMIGAPEVTPSILLQRYLEPAANDAFKACGMSITLEPRRASTTSAPAGKIRDVLVAVQLPEIDPDQPSLLDEPTAWKAKPLGQNRKRGRPRRPEVASTGNVVALRTARTTFAKMPSIGSVESQDLDAKDGPIEF